VVNPALKQPAVRRLLAVALLAELAYASLNLSTMPVYLRDARGFGEAAVGIVLGVFLGTEAVAKLVTGRWADRYGTRRLIVFGPLLSVVSVILTLAAPGANGAAWETVLQGSFRVLDGIGAAMVWPALFASIAGATNERDRPTALSMLNACYLIGIALAFPLAGWINDQSRQSSAGLGLAAILFIAASLLALGLRDHRPHSQSTGLHLSRVSPWLLATGFLAFAGIGFPSFIAKLFPMDEFRMSEGQVGLLVLPTAILLAVLSAPAGRLATRWGARTTVFAGLVLCAIGTGIIGMAAIRPEARTIATVMVAAPLVGVGFLVALPAWYAFVGGAAGSATRLGAVMAAQGIGAIAAAPLGAAMYEKLQPFGVASRLGPGFAHWSPFLAASGCLSAAAIVFLAASGPAREPSDGGR